MCWCSLTMPTSFKVESNNWCWWCGWWWWNRSFSLVDSCLSHWNFVLLVPIMHAMWIVQDLDCKKYLDRQLKQNRLWQKDICAVQCYGNSRLPLEREIMMRWTNPWVKVSTVPVLQSVARLAKQTRIHYEEQRLPIRWTNLTLTICTRTETRSAIKTMNSCLPQGVEVWSVPKEDKPWILNRSWANTPYICVLGLEHSVCQDMTFKKNHKKYFASNKDFDWEQNRSENMTILQWTRTVKIAVKKRNL